MSSAHTRVLIKVVAKGFYRAHTGLLLSLFILIFSNFFYTNVLNQTHLTPDQIIETALKLAISSVSEPQGVAIFAGIMWAYSAKTWQYARARLQAPDAAFLYYSLNALPQPRQLRAWAAVQLAMSVPLLLMGAYAMLVGAAYGYRLVPLLVPAYLLALTAYGAQVYFRLTNNLYPEPTSATSSRWLRAWPKPLFSLFLFELLGRQRVAFVVTKVAALGSIALLFGVFPGAHSDPRLLGVVGLSVALIHAVLVYQSHEFELTYLRFARNLPYSKNQQFGQQLALYGLLLLPEALYIFGITALPQALLGFLMMLGVTLLFRTVLYRTGRRTNQYLRVVFGLFMGLLLLGLFGYTAPLAIGSLLAAWGLHLRHRPAD
ncbi:hypothetical protein ACFPAF_00635 [Hymenobacter endophyticus]|uniref:Uncharacterized protein n=1 Tax=Hymenobacter endophyticus TaxID=3076335 RepID=A0ABU3TBY8_9BACT|nr:hypothetical protein [Hymenobacter endophyticus]MDU0368883.1 hypothetical protein [Hymenobacter endophyticus]